VNQCTAMIQKWQKNITSRVNTAEEVTRVNDIKIETLTEQERKLIQIIRELGYGELNITVKAGKPILVNEIRKSIQLNNN